MDMITSISSINHLPAAIFENESRVWPGAR
jgi:hypothetical protein